MATLPADTGSRHSRRSSASLSSACLRVPRTVSLILLVAPGGPTRYRMRHTPGARLSTLPQELRLPRATSDAPSGAFFVREMRLASLFAWHNVLASNLSLDGHPRRGSLGGSARRGFRVRERLRYERHDHVDDHGDDAQHEARYREALGLAGPAAATQRHGAQHDAQDGRD